MQNVISSLQLWTLCLVTKRTDAVTVKVAESCVIVTLKLKF